MRSYFDDAHVRSAAFEWLSAQVAAHGDVLPRKILAEGFVLDGMRVPLLGPQGIFKPQVLGEIPLSITTAPEGPYDDAFGAEGLLRYRYRGTDPDHPENRGLRKAMMAFSVAVDDMAHVARLGTADVSVLRVSEEGAEARRAYVTAAVRVRLHQRAFRERVLEAYRHQCAFCRFRPEELLDAAHIVPDSHPEGEPVVRNGLALCTLHLTGCSSACDRTT